jgi:hypothetical protein
VDAGFLTAGECGNTLKAVTNEDDAEKAARPDQRVEKAVAGLLDRIDSALSPQSVYLFVPTAHTIKDLLVKAGCMGAGCCAILMAISEG